MCFSLPSLVFNASLHALQSLQTEGKQIFSILFHSSHLRHLVGVHCHSFVLSGWKAVFSCSVLFAILLLYAFLSEKLITAVWEYL